MKSKTRYRSAWSSALIISTVYWHAPGVLVFNEHRGVPERLVPWVTPVPKIWKSYTSSSVQPVCGHFTSLYHGTKFGNPIPAVLCSLPVDVFPLVQWYFELLGILQWNHLLRDLRNARAAKSSVIHRRELTDGPREAMGRMNLR